MTKVKFKWTIAEKLTGLMRVSSKRHWPTAKFSGTDLCAVTIYCENSYNSRIVKSGQHAELTVCIADHSRTPWVWRKLKRQAKTLAEAKDLATRLYQNHPEYLPEELRPTTTK